MSIRRVLLCSGAFWALPPAPVTAMQTTPPDTTWYVEVEGARLFVRGVGTGTPVVILHGGPGMSHDYLAPQLSDLLSGEHRLIFYDQRASGRSTGLEDTNRITMAGFVEDLEELRRELGLDRMNLLGHSFGGLLALYYAAAHPERVERLMLVDSSPASWELNFPFFREEIARRQTEADRQQLRALEEAAGGNFDPPGMDLYLRVFFRAFFHDPGLSEELSLGIDEAWIAKNQVTGDRVWQSIGRYDIHERLGVITAPTLILHGSESVIDPEGARAIQERIHGSRFILLEDVGHFPYIEAPEEFAAAAREFFR